MMHCNLFFYYNHKHKVLQVIPTTKSMIIQTETYLIYIITITITITILKLALITHETWGFGFFLDRLFVLRC